MWLSNPLEIYYCLLLLLSMVFITTHILSSYPKLGSFTASSSPGLSQVWLLVRTTGLALVPFFVEYFVCRLNSLFQGVLVIPLLLCVSCRSCCPGSQIIYFLDTSVSDTPCISTIFLYLLAYFFK